MLQDIAELGEEGWVCWSFSNHDVERAVSRWNPKRRPGDDGGGDPDPAFARMLMALLLCLRGSVCVYQGEELGLPEAELKFEELRDPFGITYWPEFRGRDGSRTPMPWRARARHAGFTEAPEAWLPVPRAHRALAVDVQEEDPGALLHAWRRFLAWRRAHPALVRGTMRPLDLPEPWLGFERALDGERMLVAFNLGDAPARLDLRGGGEARPLLGGHGFDAALEGTATVAVLPPYGVLFATLGGGAAAAPAPPDRAMIDAD
jgi:alpha-glucosidase